MPQSPAVGVVLSIRQRGGGGGGHSLIRAIRGHAAG